MAGLSASRRSRRHSKPGSAAPRDRERGLDLSRGTARGQAGRARRGAACWKAHPGRRKARATGPPPRRPQSAMELTRASNVAGDGLSGEAGGRADVPDLTQELGRTSAEDRGPGRPRPQSAMLMRTGLKEGMDGADQTSAAQVIVTVLLRLCNHSLIPCVGSYRENNAGHRALFEVCQRKYGQRRDHGVLSPIQKEGRKSAA